MSTLTQDIDRKIQAEASGAPEEDSAFWKALNFVNRPNAAVMGALAAGIRGEDAGSKFVQGLTGESKASGRDLMTALGMPEDSGWTTAAGVAADVLNPLDPLLYVGGLGGLTKAGKAARLGGGLAKDWGEAAKLGQRALLSFMGRRIPVPGDRALLGLVQDAGNRTLESGPGQWLITRFGTQGQRMENALRTQGIAEEAQDLLRGQAQAAQRARGVWEATNASFQQAQDALMPGEKTLLSDLQQGLERGDLSVSDVTQRFLHGKDRDVKRRTSALNAMFKQWDLQRRTMVEHKLPGWEMAEASGDRPHFPMVAEVGPGKDLDAVSEALGKANVGEFYPKAFAEGAATNNGYNRGLALGVSMGIKEWNLTEQGASELAALGMASNPGTTEALQDGYRALVQQGGTAAWSRFLDRPGIRRTATELNALAKTGLIPVEYATKITARTEAAHVAIREALATEASVDFLKREGVAVPATAKHFADAKRWDVVNMGKYADEPLAIPKDYQEKVAAVTRAMTPGPGNAMIGGMTQEIINWMKAGQLHGLPFVPLRIQFTARNIANGLWKNWIEGVPLYRMPGLTKDGFRFASILHAAPEVQEQAWFTLPRSGLRVNGRRLVEEYVARGMAGLSTINPELFSKLEDGAQQGVLRGFRQKPSEAVLKSRDLREAWYKRHFAMNELAEAGPIRFPLYLDTLDRTFALMRERGHAVGDVGPIGQGAAKAIGIAPAEAAAARPALAAAGVGEPARDAASEFLRAARETPKEGWFGDNKVFIGDAWRTYLKQHPGSTISLEDFKARLVEAHRAGDITLARADLVEAMRPEQVLESETAHLNARYNFINTELGPGRKPVARSAEPPRRPQGPALASVNHPGPVPTPDKPVPVDIEGVHPSQVLSGQLEDRAFENAEAAIKRAHFDYGDLTDFEKRYLRSFWIPYYGWFRKNIPHEVENMLTQPGKYIPLVRGYLGAMNAQGMTPEDLPNFMRDTLTVPVGRDDQGNPTVINFQSWLPTMDVTDFLGAARPWQNDPLERDWFSRMGQYLGTKTNPLVEQAIEAGTGKELLTGRDVSDTQMADVFGLPMGRKKRNLVEALVPAVQALDIANPPVPWVAPEGVFTAVAKKTGVAGPEGTRPGRNEPGPGMRVLRNFVGVRPYAVDERRQQDMSRKQLRRLVGEWKSQRRRALQEGAEGEARWYEGLIQKAQGG